MSSKAEQEQAQKERAERQAEIARKMKEKQTVVPAGPAPTTVQQQDAATCRAALEAAGWTISGLDDKGDPMFADPMGEGDRKGTYVEAKELPNRDGEPTIVKQLRVPPSSWSYRLGEAFTIQQARDKAKKGAA